MLGTDNIVDGTCYRQDQLCIRQNVHCRADDQLGSCMDLEPVSQFFKGILSSTDQIKPLDIIRQEFSTHLSNCSGCTYHGSRSISKRNIHDIGRLTESIHSYSDCI